MANKLDGDYLIIDASYMKDGKLVEKKVRKKLSSYERDFYLALVGRGAHRAYVDYTPPVLDKVDDEDIDYASLYEYDSDVDTGEKKIVVNLRKGPDLSKPVLSVKREMTSKEKEELSQYERRLREGIPGDDTRFWLGLASDVLNDIVSESIFDLVGMAIEVLIESIFDNLG